MKRKVLTGILLFLLAAGLIFLVLPKKIIDNVHYHAGFVVYVNGLRQDYSDVKYMSLDVCSIKDNDVTTVSLHKEKAHLHDLVGDVVHVHDAKATWADLFRNMGVQFPAGPVYGYRNGKAVSGIMNEVIKPYDSVIIMIGKKAEITQADYVTKAHIQAAEKNSETCGR